MNTIQEVLEYRLWNDVATRIQNNVIYKLNSDIDEKLSIEVRVNITFAGDDQRFLRIIRGALIESLQ